MYICIGFTSIPFVFFIYYFSYNFLLIETYNINNQLLAYSRKGYMLSIN